MAAWPKWPKRMSTAIAPVIRRWPSGTSAMPVSQRPCGSSAVMALRFEAETGQRLEQRVHKTALGTRPRRKGLA